MKFKKILLGTLLTICFVLTGCTNSEMNHPYIGSNGNWWYENSDLGVPAQGENGIDGVSIVNIEKTNSEENIDTYTVTYSDGTSTTFTVTNGEDGKQGIQGIQGEKGEDGHTPTIVIGENGNWIIDGVDTGVSYKGATGDTGNDGVSVVTIEKTNSEGNVDTYTITYSDGTTSTFLVTNGEDGEQGIQGLPGKDGHTPVISIGENGNWFIDGIDTGKTSRGDKGDKGEDGEKGDPGDKGDTGLSAYELYLKYHPEYTGTEEEWIEDVVNGSLGQIVITFDTDGGNNIESQTIKRNSYVTASTPKKAGYIFDCWTLNGSEIDLNTFVFTTSSTLKAKWKAKEITLNLDAGSGNLDYNVMNIFYGETYTLPIPNNEYQSFNGWYIDSMKIATSGVWNYTTSNCALTAKYSSKKVTINLDVDSDYGTLDASKKTQSITIGSDYTLSIPTALTEFPFQGYYYGETQVTDNNGMVINQVNLNNNDTLTAKFYTEINSIYDLMGMQNGITGSYKLMTDLDFNGIEFSPIAYLDGTFDGGGHTISNLRINGIDRTQYVESHGSFIKELKVGSIFKNINFENINTDTSWSSFGIIGKAYTENTCIGNISINNSFNDSTGDILYFGAVIGNVRPKISSNYNGNEYVYVDNDEVVNKQKFIQVSNIKINNSCESIDDLENCKWSFMIGKYSDLRVDEYSYLQTYNGSTKYFYNCGLLIENVVIKSNFQYLNGAGVIGGLEFLHETNNKSNSNTNFLAYMYRPKNIIKNFYLDCNGLTSNTIMNTEGLTISPTGQGSISVNLCVYEFSNIGKVNTLWNGTKSVEDSINIGEFDSVITYSVSFNRYIDAGIKYGQYEIFNNNFKNSIHLIPDDNGKYHYFSNAGGELTISSADFITKEFFTQVLGMNESVWDFDNIDIESSIYPTIR